MGLPTQEAGDAVVEMDPLKELASPDAEESDKTTTEKKISFKLLLQMVEGAVAEMVVEMPAAEEGGDPTRGYAWKNHAKKVTTRFLKTSTTTMMVRMEEGMLMDPMDTTRPSSFIMGGFVADRLEEAWVVEEEDGAADAVVLDGDLSVMIRMQLSEVPSLEKMPPEKQVLANKEEILLEALTQQRRPPNTIPLPRYKMPTTLGCTDTASVATLFVEEGSVDEAVEEALQVVHMS